MRRNVGILKIIILFYLYNIKLILKEVKDCLVLFAIVFIVLGTPTWLGYILFFIFKWEWSLAMATGYLFFWNIVPCTPYIAICIFITLALNRLFK